jgi:hypothetical protein
MAYEPKIWDNPMFPAGIDTGEKLPEPPVFPRWKTTPASWKIAVGEAAVDGSTTTAAPLDWKIPDEGVLDGSVWSIPTSVTTTFKIGYHGPEASECAKFVRTRTLELQNWLARKKKAAEDETDLKPLLFTHRLFLPGDPPIGPDTDDFILNEVSTKLAIIRQYEALLQEFDEEPTRGTANRLDLMENVILPMMARTWRTHPAFKRDWTLGIED